MDNPSSQITNNKSNAMSDSEITDNKNDSKDNVTIKLSLATQFNERVSQWMEKNRSLSLRQTPIWAQTLAGSLFLLGTISIVAGVFYRIDEVVTVSGQLKSIGGTIEVKTPAGGKIKAVYFEDGDTVKKGDLLLRFDATQAVNDIQSAERLMATEKKSSSSRIKSYTTQLSILKTRAAVISKKLNTKQMFLSEYQKLEQLGGVSRIQVFDMKDRVLELEESFASTNNQIEQLQYQMDSLKLESQKTLERLSNDIARNELQVQYQNVHAPADGVVFDQVVREDSVQPSGERLLSIVSQKGLYAEVNIPNKDIGYVKEGQTADVRIDAFPFAQFGTLDAVLESVGADALKPTETIPFYSFLGKLKLDSDYLSKGDRKIYLKPGMSITTNLNLGNKPLISLVSDMFVEQVDSVKSIRQTQPGG